MTAVVFEEAFFYANGGLTGHVGSIVGEGDAPDTVRVEADVPRRVPPAGVPRGPVPPCAFEVPASDVRQIPTPFGSLFR